MTDQNLAHNCGVMIGGAIKGQNARYGGSTADVGKVYAIVARSTFPSENSQKTGDFGPI